MKLKKVSNYKRVSMNNFAILGIFQIILILLKVFLIQSVSWFWILIPLWIMLFPVAFGGVFLITFGIVFVIVAIFEVLFN